MESEGLRRFCEELSSDEPVPGGGSASAAAGAMAASLLSMVCGIGVKSKKQAEYQPELERLAAELKALRDSLISLAEEDATAYEGVLDALRAKARLASAETATAYDRALERAADVPLRTAQACLDVLVRATRVAEIGRKTMASDIGVAALLAEAGLKGAVMNVRINLASMRERDTAARYEATADAFLRKGVAAARDALARL